MDQKQFIQDKLNLIGWITQIQDHTLIEKIKNLINASNEHFHLTKEQEELIAIKKGEEIGFIAEDEVFPLDSKIEHKL